MMSRQFSRKLHLLLPFCRRMKLLWCPWFKNDFGFLFTKKLVAQKKSFWSSDPHQAIFLHILQTSYLAFTFDPTYFLTSYLDLAFYLVYLSLEILRGWGPAGNTLIQRLLLGSGGEHSDPELAVEVPWETLWSGAWRWRSGGEHFDPEVVAGVRRGTLWSWACCSGPGGKTAI